MVSRVLGDAGATILGWGVDGASHRVVEYEVAGCRKKFRIPSSGRVHGHALKNSQANLKRQIKEITEAKTGGENMLPSEALEHMKPPVITKAKRKEIAQRYLVLGSIGKVVDETGLYWDEIVRELKKAGGEAATRCRQEVGAFHRKDVMNRELGEGKLPRTLLRLVDEIAAEQAEKEETVEEPLPEQRSKRRYTKQPTPEEYRALYAEKIPGATLHEVDDGIILDLTCKLCGPKEGAFVADKRVLPYVAIRDLRAEGWRVGATADNHICSAHKKDTQEETPMPDAAVQMQPAADLLETPPTPEPEPATVTPLPVPSPVTKAMTPTARAARAEATRWLMESYDERRNCYKAGFSDKSIASETGLAETAVADLRESIYGPMGAPIELIELTDKIAALDDKIAAARQKMEREIEAARTAGMSAIAAVTTELEGLRTAFATISKQQGWVE